MEGTEARLEAPETVDARPLAVYLVRVTARRNPTAPGTIDAPTLDTIEGVIEQALERDVADLLTFTAKAERVDK